MNENYMTPNLLVFLYSSDKLHDYLSTLNTSIFKVFELDKNVQQLSENAMLASLSTILLHFAGSKNIKRTSTSNLVGPGLSPKP